MTARRLLLLPALLLGAQPGCSNYDFRTAIGPDRSLDLARLKADASRAGLLYQTTWLPLIHRSQLACQWRSESAPPAAPELESAYPPGLTLMSLRAHGPLFAYFHRRESRYDAALAPYESVEATGVLWRLWGRARSRVKTPGGVREEVRTELLFGILKLPSIVRYLPGP